MPGSIVGLFGESGCGKTTLALALLNLLPASRYRVRGSVQLGGFEVLSATERQLERIRGAQISLIFQDPLLALNPVLRVRRQVAEAMRAHGRQDGLESLFDLVGLPATRRMYDAYPHQLSGGERQRVVIAQALACRPALVIADEPFTALDAPRVVELSSRSGAGRLFFAASGGPQGIRRNRRRSARPVRSRPALAGALPRSDLLLWGRVRATLLLTGTATFLAWLIALPLGIWNATARGTWGHGVSKVVLSFLLAIPDLLLAIVFLVLAVETGYFPAGGMVSPGRASLSGPERVLDVAWHLVLPVAVLVLGMLPAPAVPAPVAGRGEPAHLAGRLFARYFAERLTAD